MKKLKVFLLLFITSGVVLLSFKKDGDVHLYVSNYNLQLSSFIANQQSLIKFIKEKNVNTSADVESIKLKILDCRRHLKSMDFWMRYLEPVSYKKINGPLPVEWETEVFEKFEKPYKREGAGLTLAMLYLDEKDINKDSLVNLLNASVVASTVFQQDSITSELQTYHHFYLCNRLYLLNLAAIYTTGFECPDTSAIVPELTQMIGSVENIYASFNQNFTATPLTENYLELYKKLIAFVNSQPLNYTKFDHYTFLKDYVNPLFAINQQLINLYNVHSKSSMDYTLNKKNFSIFSKSLYAGQNEKGIFLRVNDEKVLQEIEKLGKLLFYDPILSSNNERSCASCHKPGEYFTDTAVSTAFQFNHSGLLPRNTPSLINAGYNHLLMLDGKHLSLQNQASDVITNSAEMNSDEQLVLQKILSCAEYKKSLEKLLAYTPLENEITFSHITSALTLYYSKFSKYYAPFDDAMNRTAELGTSAKNGFNLFMSKAQCGTCHFVPHFNGVKPPYICSEFEVLGVPKDTTYKQLSDDVGRYKINAATETMQAFRTGSLRNSSFTKPYMHNGVFTSIQQVIDFYDAGGGAGKGLTVPNQTLSSDSLKLTVTEKADLIAFINSLNEKIIFENNPDKLPLSSNKILNNRKIGGVY